MFVQIFSNILYRDFIHPSGCASLEGLSVLLVLLLNVYPKVYFEMSFLHCLFTNLDSKLVYEMIGGKHLVALWEKS